MEELEGFDSRLLTEKIREIIGKKRMQRSTAFKDIDGTILTKRNQVLNRWQQYVGNLYTDEDRGPIELEVGEESPLS